MKGSEGVKILVNYCSSEVDRVGVRIVWRWKNRIRQYYRVFLRKGVKDGRYWLYNSCITKMERIGMRVIAVGLSKVFVIHLGFEFIHGVNCVWKHAPPPTTCSSSSSRQLNAAPPISRIKMAATSERLAVMSVFLPQFLFPADNHFFLSLVIKPDSRILCRLYRGCGGCVKTCGEG